MLSCKDVTEKSSDYLDHKLPLLTRLSVRVHLFVCVRCRTYVKQLRATVASVGLLRNQASVSEEVVETMVTALQKDTSKDP